MEASLVLFRESASHLCVVNCQHQSLKSVFYSNSGQKSKTLFALVSKCLALYPQIIAGLLKSGVVERKSLSSVHHSDSLSNPACSICLLVVATYDLTCGRKPFGCRGAAMRILKENTKVLKAASTLRRVMKGILKDSNSEKTTITYCIPVYARVNSLHLCMSEAVERLQNEYLFTQINYDRDKTSYSEFLTKVQEMKPTQFLLDYHFPQLILVFPPGTDLHLNRMYISNSLIIQDKASCIPALVLLNYLHLPKPGRIEIIDACASPGNKTTLLLSGLCANNQPGYLIAIDRDAKRFNQLCKNLYQYDDYISLTVNGDPPQTLSPSGDGLNVAARLTDFLSIDPYDSVYSNLRAILLDPSCSNSGVHCRRPEFSTGRDGGGSETAERIQRLANLQSKLLRHALSFPSVRLVVYSTCSTHQQENEDVVREQGANFASSFKLLKIWHKSSCSRTCPFSPVVPWDSWGSGGGDEISRRCLRALPEKDLTIGFFVACFRRRSDKLKQI